MMDRYQLLNRIGKGTFGTIYLARDRLAPLPHGSEPVVVKVCALPTNREEREAVLREVSLLNDLHHPYLTHCLNAFVDSTNRLCIVMPYYSGGDLGAIVKKNKARGTRLPEPIVLQWLAQLTLALENMHWRRVLHRDIKGDNVFLSKPDAKGKIAVLLGDFGIARVLEHSGALAQTTCGTPYYMSPELMRGAKYNDKSDVWALGCVLYELMALQVPFNANVMSELAKKVLHTDPPPLPESYSAGLRATVMAMLQKDPERRPSALELLRQPLLSANVDALLAGVTPEPSASRPKTGDPKGAARGRPVMLPRALPADEQQAATCACLGAQKFRVRPGGASPRVVYANNGSRAAPTATDVTGPLPAPPPAEIPRRHTPPLARPRPGPSTSRAEAETAHAAHHTRHAPPPRTAPPAANAPARHRKPSPQREPHGACAPAAAAAAPAAQRLPSPSPPPHSRPRSTPDAETPPQSRLVKLPGRRRRVSCEGGEQAGYEFKVDGRPRRAAVGSEARTCNARVPVA